MDAGRNAHNVRLVDRVHSLAPVKEGELEGVLGEAAALRLRDELERLDDAGHHLVLHAGVFALGVLADEGEVDALVAGLQQERERAHIGNRVSEKVQQQFTLSERW